MEGARQPPAVRDGRAEHGVDGVGRIDGAQLEVAV
jgi:hypothetical protein